MNKPAANFVWVVLLLGLLGMAQETDYGPFVLHAKVNNVLDGQLYYPKEKSTQNKEWEDNKKRKIYNQKSTVE